MARLRSSQVAHKVTHKAPISVFIASTIVVFFMSLSAADSIGFVPDYIDGTPPAGGAASTDLTSADQVPLADLPQLGETNLSVASTPAAQTAFPLHITIASVGIDLPVQNPSTTDIDALDALLVSGPARYAPSAKLGENGNVIIFAHSSHLPIVRNKMYQAFNRIPDVREGATIAIQGSDGREYIYSVDSLVKADTNDGVEIPLRVASGAELTLVTCDTLTGKSARYILTASFIGTN